MVAKWSTKNAKVFHREQYAIYGMLALLVGKLCLMYIIVAEEHQDADAVDGM